MCLAKISVAAYISKSAVLLSYFCYIRAVFRYPIEIKDMNPKLLTVILLVISNIFMTIAWYGHLKLQTAGISRNWPLIAVILLSWGVALIEYCFMIPANRIGFDGNGGPFSLIQLKVIQEVISLAVFTVLAMFLFQGQQIHWNHLAAYLCLIAAVFFAFLPGK